MAKQVRVSTYFMDCNCDLTRDELIARMDKALQEIPAASRATATFGIDEYNLSYDPNTYYAIFLKYDETEEEQAKREAEEETHRQAVKERELKELDRLQAKFYREIRNARISERRERLRTAC